jgi:hypothetical protein
LEIVQRAPHQRRAENHARGQQRGHGRASDPSSFTGPSWGGRGTGARVVHYAKVRGWRRCHGCVIPSREIDREALTAYIYYARGSARRVASIGPMVSV